MSVLLPLPHHYDAVAPPHSYPLRLPPAAHAVGHAAPCAAVAAGAPPDARPPAAAAAALARSRVPLHDAAERVQQRAGLLAVRPACRAHDVGRVCRLRPGRVDAVPRWPAA